VLKCSQTDGVAVLTLNRPEVRNALSRELRNMLRSRIRELDEDDNICAIVLTGEDPAFCAGVDLRELENATDADLGDVGPFNSPIVSSTTPLIGAINGPAYTGGLELALACHFLIASEQARFADTHARLGLMPGWGMSVLLTEAVGSRRARELSVSSQPIDAQTALSWGMVNRVVPHAELLSTAISVGRTIAENVFSAVKRVSRLYNDQAAVRDAAGWRLEAGAWTAIESMTKSGIGNYERPDK